MRLLKIFLIAIMALADTAAAFADATIIEQVNYYGPYDLSQAPGIGDTSEINDAPCAYPLNLDGQNATSMLVASLPSQELQLHAIAFNVENRKFTKIEFEFNGFDKYEATIDGKKIEGKLDLHPGTHKIVVKYLVEEKSDFQPEIKINSSKENVIECVVDGARMFTLEDVLYGTRINGASLSPSGQYVIVDYSDVDENDKPATFQKLYDAKTLLPMRTLAEKAKWLEKEDKFYVVRNDFEHRRHIVAIDAANGSEEILADHIPDGDFVISPEADYLLYTLKREGKKENALAYQVLEPEDRQPGWRDRHYPAIYHLNRKILMPLLQGEYDMQVTDISADGNKILIMTHRTALGQRPSILADVIVFDLDKMAYEKVVDSDGFISMAKFSPDGMKLLITGSPEAFNRIGCILPQDVTPSMSEQELFEINLGTKDIRPLTKDFYPSIENASWSRYDGKIYARAENHDAYCIYRIDPSTCSCQIIELPENIVKGFALSPQANAMAWWGQSDSNPDGAYLMNLKTKKNQLLDRPSESRLKDVVLSKCIDWNFINEKGDTIYGRYYLPDNFDPAKKYPLIVNYYGGCSPSQRTFESRYPWHIYAPLGYVIYVVQPSGATGFGQEFSSRHVSTAGKGVAEDILQGTQQFIKEHDFIDVSKVGCIGASYGGFMTQYLQTVSDMFAAAISHAGISDHTSYWSEGYWGYSYSEVSMGEDLPWTNPDLYVKQSPLYNADKINTPILFLHGDKDMNVPVGESIQMFTALKRLGKDATFVAIADQDHHIIDFKKRKHWQDTIFAWFAKYLQDDPEWWDSMYPAKGK